MPDRPLSVLIAEDEPHGRALLRRYVGLRPELTLSGEAEDGPAAVSAVGRLRPDLLLLDIQMPGMDGFAVLAALAEASLPLPRIVFTTAYDQHAVRAFEVNAVDYLLKPIPRARFDAAIDRALKAVAPDQPVQRLMEDTLRAPPTRLLVRSAGALLPVPISAIEWIEAEADYARLHVGRQQHLLERSMAELERALAPAGFARVHRSAIVRLSAIREIRSEGAGRHRLLLASGAEVFSSRSYQHLFHDWRL